VSRYFIPMTINMSDRRRHERRQIDLPILAVLESGVRRLNATLVNVSQSGAMLKFGEETELPESFYLLIPQHRLQPCTIVWRESNLAGVSYTS